MSDSETNSGKVRKSKTFWGLLVVTLIYFGVYYLLVLETKTCDPMQEWVEISPHWFIGFWDRYLGCRQVNELGDALAGAFAPVAFLWLAGAVHIQSQELAEQRRELNETQEVMRDQLRVSEEQVKETKASTALLKLQTEILDNQNKLRLADDEFDKTLHLIRTKLMGLGNEIGYCLRDSSGREVDVVISGRMLTEISDVNFFSAILVKVETAVNRVPSSPLSHVEITNQQMWVALLGWFSDITRLVDQCSPAYKRLSVTYCVADIHNALEALYDGLEELKTQTGGPGGPGGAVT